MAKQRKENTKKNYLTPKGPRMKLLRSLARLRKRLRGTNNAIR